MEMDAPEHTQLRRLVSRPFAPKSVAEYEDAVRELAAEILDSLDTCAEFNFVQRVARELPMRMLGRLLGLPDEDLEWLVQRGDALIGNTDPDFTDYVVDQVDTSAYRLLPFRSPVALELFEYAAQALEERRLTPTHDILSALLEPTADGESLDDLALKNFFTLMVAAGNDTTRYTMTGGLLALIERPELLRRDSHDVPRRAQARSSKRCCAGRRSRCTFAGPLTAGHRTSTESTLKAGDKVVLWYTSANFDEEHFDDARGVSPRPLAERSRGLRTAQPAPLPRRPPRAPGDARALRGDGPALARASSSWTSPSDLRSNFISGIKTLPVRVEPGARGTAGTRASPSRSWPR